MTGSEPAHLSAFKSNEDPTFADAHTPPPAPCPAALYIEPDLVLILSRDEWLIAAAEAVCGSAPIRSMSKAQPAHLCGDWRMRTLLFIG
jgi:hypothetical protein